MRWIATVLLMLAAACSGVAYNTRVADTAAARGAIAASVVPGTTTEAELVTRWGNPVQKIRDGGQTAFIYRDMRNPRQSFPLPQYGTSERWVIVTFQYGLVTGVITSDEVDCRATFTPRPPNYTFDNPTEVRLAGACAPSYAKVGQTADPAPVEADIYEVGKGAKGK